MLQVQGSVFDYVKYIHSTYILIL